MAYSGTAFPIQGTEVRLDALLALRFLAADLERVTGRRSRGARLGDQRSPFRGQGREFMELRRYQPGDDVRRIDWHVTARKQAPYVQVMEEDRQTPQLIWLDLSSSLYFGSRRVFKSVLACHWAAFLAWRLVSLQHPTTGLITGPGGQVPLPLRRPGDVAAFCQRLVSAHRCLAEQYLSGTEAPGYPVLQSRLTHHPAVWMISDLTHWRPEQLALCLPAARLGRLVVLQPLDSVEIELPDVGPLDLEAGEHSARLDTSSFTVRSGHRRRHELRQQTWRDWAAAHKADVISHLSQPFEWSEVRQWPIQG